MEFQIHLKVVLFLIVFFGCQLKTVTCLSSLKSNSSTFRSTIEIIEQSGYPAESHHVRTEDGYILELHRIPHGKNSEHPTKTFPVFIQHGFQGSSADFVLLGPGNALAFLLADAGYDVWLGNFRGNRYSKAHIKLTPNKKAFWNFSWHEHGIYDVPASIDHVLEKSGSEKLIYIGYSMGTKSFLAMTSMRPDYQDKIQEAVLLAVTAFTGHRKIHLKTASVFINQIPPVDLILHEELGRRSLFYKMFVESFCSLPKNINVCVFWLQFLVGFDYKTWPEHLTKDVFQHFPAGASVKTLVHMNQNTFTGRFNQFDYKLKNILIYGSKTPPDYNLSNVRTKIHLFEGYNDNLSVPKDVEITNQKIKSIQRIEYVNYTKFNHIDFVYSKSAKTLLYDRVLEVVDEIDRNGEQKYFEEHNILY